MSFSVVSTFSGGGGSCLGYKMAGGKVLVANEFVKEAQETYRLNFPDTKLLTGDIRKLSGRDFLDAAELKPYELDIFDGSPPCSAFSIAGSGSKGWGKEKEYSGKSQVVDDLFFEYARILNEIKPKVFIAENVKGLISGNAKGYFKEIHKALTSCGYRVKAKVLNAANYGVPQTRERLIFVGVRNDIEKEFFYPTKNAKTVTIKDVHPHIVMTKKSGRPGNWHPSNRPAGTIVKHIPALSGYFSECYVKEKDGKPRLYTVSELKVLQSLPSDFTITGTFKEQWERVGRMVPPLLMKAVAEAAYNGVLKNV